MLSTLLVAVAMTAAPAEAVEVAPDWAGHPVGFCLLTHPPYQYVAYYDADRTMTVAQRQLDTTAWTYTVLPERVGWDSHNAITMTIDDAGHLHLAGNMHVDPLRYFRTAAPYDASTFERHRAMVGTEEQRATYPKFFRGADGELIFTYRDGSSGSGNQIYNAYDLDTQTWRRLLDTPLVDGRGEMNAYFDGPRLGPDGYFHLVWVWRDTPDCATNHDPSYARSRDLVHWERSDGTPYALPITFDTAEIVDPVPSGGGVINMNIRIGWDEHLRPVVTYHKFDEAGNTQIYNTRREGDVWQVRQSSDWDYRWAFSGGGAIGAEIHIQPVTAVDGAPEQRWSHKVYGSQRWRLDSATLAPVEQLPIPPSPLPAELRTVRSGIPGMQVHLPGGIGSAGEPGVRYFMRWETLGTNRDRPREKPWPEASMLEVIRIAP